MMKYDSFNLLAPLSNRSTRPGLGTFVAVSAILLIMTTGCGTPTADDSAAVGTTTDPGTGTTAPTMTEPRVAETGVGKQGQSLENESGVGKMISQPVTELFKFKQKTVFEIQIPQAMNLYKALNGEFPNSHEKFMSEIIKKNQIKLPELPEGQVYKYHPDDSQLWVEPAESQ